MGDQAKLIEGILIVSLKKTKRIPIFINKQFIFAKFIRRKK